MRDDIRLFDVTKRQRRTPPMVYDVLVAELRTRTILTPSRVLRRVRATPQGVFLSLPVCYGKKDPIALAAAVVMAQPPAAGSA